MKLSLKLALLLLPVVGGCSFFDYSCRNLISAPVDSIQECVFRHRLRTLARQAWDQVRRENPKGYSNAYAEGFEAGFVDYIDRNGTGEPPAIPPLCLQRDVLRSPAGQEEITDWYAGFRHGTATAQASGLRERVVVPIALPPRKPTDPAQRDLMETFPPQPRPIEAVPTSYPGIMAPR